jgi:hypothetical protein
LLPLLLACDDEIAAGIGFLVEILGIVAVVGGAVLRTDHDREPEENESLFVGLFTEHLLLEDLSFDIIVDAQFLLDDFVLFEAEIGHVVLRVLDAINGCENLFVLVFVELVYQPIGAFVDENI